MRIIDKKGNASIEFVCSALFLFIVAGFVRQFAMLGAEAHQISFDLQSRVEAQMIKKERASCPNIQKDYFSKKSGDETLLGKSIFKRLIFFDESICKVDNE